jgi:tetratricopeptide (TPR) repeat protein
MIQSLPKLGRAKKAPKRPEGSAGQRAAIGSGQDRGAYPDAIRDWVEKGADSQYALDPTEVVARSQPRPRTKSEGAAHFELANHLWRAGRRDLAIAHFNECHRLQPDNWTYKRQAWSLVGNERVGGEFGRFVQGPVECEEDDWPFDSDFRSDVSMLGEGEYYPKTM